MIPHVEEIRGEADFLAFAELEILDERSIPILLERSTVDVSTEVAEAGDASVARWIGPSWSCTLTRLGAGVIKIGHRCKRCRIQITIEALVNVPTGQAARKAGAGTETGTQQWGAPLSKESRACA